MHQVKTLWQSRCCFSTILITVFLISYRPLYLFVYVFIAAAGAGASGASSRSRCSEARSRAVELDRADPEGHIFIPVCQRSGILYEAAQCHTATGYCWCVDENTGNPIPGFSTRNVTPDCTQLNIKTLKGRRSPES